VRVRVRVPVPVPVPVELVSRPMRIRLWAGRPLLEQLIGFLCLDEPFCVTLWPVGVPPNGCSFPRRVDFRAVSTGFEVENKIRVGHALLISFRSHPRIRPATRVTLNDTAGSHRARAGSASIVSPSVVSGAARTGDSTHPPSDPQRRPPSRTLSPVFPGLRPRATVGWAHWQKAKPLRLTEDP